MQADVEWIFPILLNRDRYGSSFLQCPVNCKMFITFSGMFSLTCQIDRVKARRKLGFGFGMITLDLDAPLSNGDSAVKIIISQM